ncbi:hypothetical protein C1878_01780 [Gordonibacter sp. 28C]|uniref:EAL domain-containing protein n=1 Tax=Gordonibacter sp. 28C TaxID=2078569 RepID=UPI000DF86038|nr:EAL domain-containing protein [Gordonibacter sp. 28C]RDB64602.1 hypothetical protein C1878_01780 [Gordonibacter sp. 28C]
MSSDVSNNPSMHRHTYVIDCDYRVVYMDKAAHRVFPSGQIGALCYESFRGATEPCKDCPWHGHEHDAATQTVIFSARRDLWYEITCLETDWFDRGPCVLFSGRPISDQSRSLFASLSEPSSYDELFEINMTNDSYKVLYTEPDKYVMPALEGTLSIMFEDVLNNMIYPEDRDRFLELWDFDTLTARLEQAGGALRGEFRKRLCAGGWGWAAQTVVPVKRGESGEAVVMCFITDIDAEVKTRKERADTAQIQRLRERDQLTGLYNASTFYEKATELLAARPDLSHEAVYLDIEHFKLFNEWHGREAGDNMLRAIADRLAAIAQRFEGVAGYLGGDDFTLVLPCGVVSDEKIEEQFKLPPFDSEDTIGFRPAIGICSIDRAGGSVGTACDHAMLAMATVKGSFARRAAWYENAMSEELESEAKTLLEVQQALRNREFVLHWQPQCNTRTGRIVGLEALVRWQHPERGLVMPGDFIPVLERNGFIASLDLYVWDEACRHLRSWIDRGKRPIPVSVNISRADLYAIDVVDTLEGLVQNYGLDHHLLELEITESAYAEDEKMAEAANDLKELGFTILMDDFGSGYSSLNMLKDITVDILKIDMGFLVRESDAQRSESILEAVVSMARLMDLRIIAEGAETKEQVDFLQDIGCDYAQGYYFHRPMDTVKLEALISNDDVIDYRGVLSPLMDLIDMNALLNEDETSRTIVDNLIGGMAVYAVYPDRFELLQVNNAYYRVTGCNSVDLRERQHHISKQVHPDDLPIVMDLFAQAEQHPVSGAEGTFRRYRLNGNLMWLRMKTFFLRREQNRNIFFASLADVTEQKEQEEELRSSQSALSNVLGLPFAEKSLDDMTTENRQAAAQVFMRNVPGGLIGGYCEDGFPLLFANEEIARMAGYDTTEEFIEAMDGMVANSIHPDDLPQVTKDIGPEYYEGLEYTTQYRMPRKDGTWFWVADHGRIVRTKNNRLAIASVCIDIDNTVSMQKQLAVEDEMLYRIIRRANLNVWIYDIEHDAITFQNLSSNGIASLLAQADLPNVLPKGAASDLDANALPDDVGRILKRMAREVQWGRNVARDIEVQTDDDEILELRVTCEAVTDPSGKPARVIGYMEETKSNQPAAHPSANSSRLLEMLKGKAVEHWYVNLSTKSFLSAADRKAWRKATGIVLEDWSGTTPQERIGEVVRSQKDAEAVEAFLDFDAMLSQYKKGSRFGSLEFRQWSEKGERWMELSYRLIRLEEGGSVFAHLSVSDIDERKRRELELEDKAAHDALTGLMNRQAASTLLPGALEETLRKGTSGALIIIDLDDFKQVNDEYGHLAGDVVLSGIGRHLKSAFRKNDLVCRWGGDEFIVYCDDISRSSLSRRVGTLCDTPWKTQVQHGTSIELSASAGIALVPGHGSKFTEVYERADEALYCAKSDGKAHFRFYEAG